MLFLKCCVCDDMVIFHREIQQLLTVLVCALIVGVAYICFKTSIESPRMRRLFFFGMVILEFPV